jgi:Cysteine rich repeat
MNLIKAIGAISIFSLAAMSAFATDTAPQSGSPVAAACKQDVQTLCTDVKPGEGRVKECMKSHHEQLSAGCKAAIKANRREHSEQAPAGAPPAGAPPASQPPGR